MRRSFLLSCCASFVLFMFAAHRASAQPIGYSTKIIDPVLPDGSGQTCSEAFSVEVCHVFVNFAGSDPIGGMNHLLSTGFSDIMTSDPVGFFQVPAVMGGGHFAPNEALFPLFPQLVCDSFVTFNLVSVPPGEIDCTVLGPNFDLCTFDCDTVDGCENVTVCGWIQGGWFCVNPPSNQGQPNPINNAVLVAQLSYPVGTTVAGEFTSFYFDGSLSYVGSFTCGSTCPTDLNGDGQTNAGDLALLLGGWGENPGHVADLDDDGFINAIDLALLLGHWGDCM